jgi:hypothetical protein
MLSSIPFWVPLLFVVLLFLGYRESLPRTVKPATLVGIALAMLGFSLYGVVSTFGPEPLALLLWVSGYIVAVVLGARHFASRGLVAVGTSVRIPGSWVPLVLFLSIFAAKFTLGFASGVRSPLLLSAAFIATMSGLLGALSGGFGARALAIHRFAAATSAA